MSSAEPERDLRAALDSVQAVPARAEFKAQLAKSFLAGCHVSAESVGSSSEGASADAVLDAWQVPMARPEFREALRAQFLAEEPVSDNVAPIHSIRAYLAVAVAAAALVLFWFAPWKSAIHEGWHAIGFDHAKATPVVAIDGEDVPYTDFAALNSAFHRGCQIETSTEALQVLRVEEGVLLEIAEATRLEVARIVGKGDAMDLHFVITTGAFRVATGLEFKGRILIQTPDAEIELAGRSLGIDVLDNGTCLCVLEGEAKMTATDGTGELHLLSNSTAFFPRAGSEGKMVEGMVHHGDPLMTLRAVGDTYLR